MHPSVTAVLEATRALWTTTPSLNAFAAWPDDLVPGIAAASQAPAAAKIIAWQPDEDTITTPLHRVIQHAAPHVNWQFIYSEAEVRRHFLDNYGYFELTRRHPGIFIQINAMPLSLIGARICITRRIIMRQKNCILSQAAQPCLSQMATPPPHWARPSTVFTPAISRMP